MPRTPEEVLTDFNEIRDKYAEIFAELVELRVPGVIDPLAAKCSVGEVCHGGEFLTSRLESVIQPAARQ
jgi:hypothetical protein